MKKGIDFTNIIETFEKLLVAIRRFTERQYLFYPLDVSTPQAIVSSWSLVWSNRLKLVLKKKTPQVHRETFKEKFYFYIFKLAPQKQAHRINGFLFKAEGAEKHRKHIRPHIPALVYCEAFTNVRLCKANCIWKTTPIYSVLLLISFIQNITCYKK